MGKFNKNSLELAKGERLTHEPKTWKLSHIFSASSLSLNFIVKTKKAKNYSIAIIVEYTNKSIMKMSSIKQNYSNNG